ncbi:CobW C-terminal domain-containing protein [Plasmodiophora brassicae]
MTSGGAVDGSVPLTVVGGWLGSGKTTLVNAMMSMLAEQGHRVALIQNEFSEAGMDPTVTDADSGQVFDNLIELAKGCVCCTVKSDLLGALQKLVDLNRFTYYILECSGLADPGRIASIFWVDEELEIPIHLDAILTVVDAAHCLDQLSASEGHCLERQIAYADRIIVNKTDLISSETKRASLLKRLSEINVMAPIRSCERAQGLQLPDLTGLNAYATSSAELLERQLSVPASCSHDHSIGAVVLGPFVDVRVDQNALTRWLAEILWDEDDEAVYGWTIFRVKGVVPGDNGRRVHVQAVQKLFDTDEGAPLDPSTKPFVKFVVIGRNLKQDLLESGLRQCFTERQ